MTKTMLAGLFAAAAIAAAGCSKSDGDAETKPADKPTEVAKPVADKPAAVDDGKAAAQMLAAYEAARAALVSDDLLGVAEPATELAAASGKAAEAAAEGAKPHYAGIAKAAGELAEAEELAAARAAFGEISRELVGLAEMSPELAKGLHVFECPMAKGYKRWIQPNAELGNPYMGEEMPGCGSEVAFGEHDMGDMKHGDMKHGDMEHGDMHGGHE